MRRQLIQICLAAENIPNEFSNHLTLEPVRDKRSVLINEIGMNHQHVKRFLETDFEPTRQGTVVNDQEYKNDFENFLYQNSDLAIRVRDQYKLRDHPEPVRARIVKKPFRTLYEEFLTQRRDEDKTPIGSKSSLKRMVKKYFRNYRAPTPGDRRFAECGTCANLTLLLANARKNNALKDWSSNINKDRLLNMTVCPEANHDCEWNQCQTCTFDRTLEQIRESIDNYDAIRNEEICFQSLVTYKAKSNSTTSTYLESCDSIEEFTVELARSMYSHGTSGTGSKVTYNILYLSSLNIVTKVYLHIKRNKECNVFLDMTLDRMRHDSKICRIQFDHGK